MSKTPLIATPTVDKNGRNTIVYRRVASSAPTNALPSPTLKSSKTDAQKPSTPLPIPAPIEESELRPYCQKLRGNMQLSTSKHPRADEAALIRDIIANGHVPDEALMTVTRYMGILSAGERIRHYDYNMLLILERVCRDKSGEFALEWDSGHEFASAVEGLGVRRRAADNITIPPITTEEELDSISAVVKMVLLVRKLEGDSEARQIADRTEYHTAEGDRLNGIFLKNHGFAALLREHYEDYENIEKFVLERGVPANKAGVEALRDYLSEEQHQAVADGWL